MYSQLFKALAVTTALASPAFANTSFELVEEDSQPESCRLAEELEEQSQSAPLSDDDAELYDFMARACGVQRGAAGLTETLDSFEGAVRDIQRTQEPVTLLQREREGQSQHLCC